MNNIHIQILSKLKIDLEHHCQKALGPDHMFSEDEQFRMLFENYRKVNDRPYGLRLTGFGNKLLSKHYDFYKYNHEEKILNKAYVVLDKSMKWPYYLGREIVTFYSHEDAAWFRLNGQNLNKYIEFM